jgi:transposase-like protein
MTNAYGVPGEVGGWPPSEAQEVECPYCHGTNTEFVECANESQTVETYVCHDCETDFPVEVDIPF